MTGSLADQSNPGSLYDVNKVNILDKRPGQPLAKTQGDMQIQDLGRIMYVCVCVDVGVCLGADLRLELGCSIGSARKVELAH